MKLGVIAVRAARGGPEKSVAGLDFSGFIEGQFLAAGAVEATAVQTAAAGVGFSPDQIRRARQRLGIKPRHTGFGASGQWIWDLPPTVEPSANAGR